MLLVVVQRVPLTNEHLPVLSVPDARPVLVCPAEAEWKFRLSGRKDLVKRLVKEKLSIEPVMIVAKGVDPVAARKVCLRNPNGRIPQIVVTKLGRHMGLIMG